MTDVLMCAGNGVPGQDGREDLEIVPAVHGRAPRAARSGPHERRSGARGRDLWAGGAIGCAVVTLLSYRRPDDAGYRP
jgi:hypothetical protein